MGQVDCPVTNVTEVLTVHMQRFQKRIEPAEFYRKAKADGSIPGLGWEHLVMVLLSTSKVCLFSSYSLDSKKLLTS